LTAESKQQFVLDFADDRGFADDRRAEATGVAGHEPDCRRCADIRTDVVRVFETETSMTDIVEATGLNESSLSNAFGPEASELIETDANLSVTNFLGLAVLMRSGADSDEVLAHLDAARHQVDSWKLS
jgi:hypothetical protein